MADFPRDPVIQSGPPQDKSAAVRSQAEVSRGGQILRVGKDTFFGAPGMGPDYDWPNPQLRKFASHAAITSQANVTQQQRNLTLYAGKDVFFRTAGYAPAFDWPNPTRRTPPVVTQLTWTQGPLIRLLGKDRFFGLAGNTNFGWENPRLRVPSVLSLTWTQAPIRTAVVADTSTTRAPIVLRGWSVDPGVALRSQANGTRRPLDAAPQPFTQNDWPNPSRRPATVQTAAYKNFQLQTGIPFAQRDWPVPRGPAAQIIIQSNGVRLLGFDTVYGAPGQAPTQDFPNPLRRPWPGVSQHYARTAAGIAPPTPSPFAQIDWTNPSRRRDGLNVGAVGNYLLPGHPPTPPPAGEELHNLQFLSTMGKLKAF